MRHCAYDLVRGCEAGVSWLVSIRRGGVRVATLELRRTGDKWLIHQLAGKANGNPKAAIWCASLFLCCQRACFKFYRRAPDSPVALTGSGRKSFWGGVPEHLHEGDSTQQANW